MNCMICGKEAGEAPNMIEVEMNVDVDGNLHANQDHLNHAERKQGWAHFNCYARWYEETYKTPFTMSA